MAYSGMVRRERRGTAGLDFFEGMGKMEDAELQNTNEKAQPAKDETLNLSVAWDGYDARCLERQR